jgi:hypothetical protein
MKSEQMNNFYKSKEENQILLRRKFKSLYYIIINER